MALRPERPEPVLTGGDLKAIQHVCTTNNGLAHRWSTPLTLTIHGADDGTPYVVVEGSPYDALQMAPDPARGWVLFAVDRKGVLRLAHADSVATLCDYLLVTGG